MFAPSTHPLFSARPATWIWIFGLGLASLLASHFWQVAEGRRADAATAMAEALRVELSTSSSLPVETVAAPTDFAAGLPDDAPVDAVVRDFQRFSTSSAVKFVSIDMTSRAATLRSLGRTEFAVVLQGDYVKIKLVLQQLLARHPQLVFQRLSLRRGQGPTELEASLGLMLLTRPLASATSLIPVGASAPTSLKN